MCVNMPGLGKVQEIMFNLCTRANLSIVGEGGLEPDTNYSFLGVKVSFNKSIKYSNVGTRWGWII